MLSEQAETYGGSHALEAIQALRTVRHSPDHQEGIVKLPVRAAKPSGRVGH